MNEWWLIFIFALLLLVAAALALYPLQRKLRPFQVGVTLILIIGSSIGYWHWGAWKAITDYLQHERLKVQAQSVLKSIKNPEELVDKLKQHLEQKPRAARGWFLLGRLYASQGKWAAAVEALDKAHQLKPHNEQFTVNYAQSMWQLNGQRFNSKIRSTYQGVLKDNPNQVDALSMLAIDAFQEKAYEKAIEYWTQLLALVPSDTADAKAIRKAIAKAQEFLQRPV